MRKPPCAVALVGLAVLVGFAAWADDPKDNPEGGQALRKRAEDFIAAFNKGDAKAVAGFGTLNGYGYPGGKESKEHPESKELK